MVTAKKALVTGAGSGIGRAIALSLAESGWHILVNDITRENTLNTVDQIVAAGGQATPLTADIGNADDVAQLFSGLTFSAPTLLVNNAGIQTWSPLLELSPVDWQNTIQTNLTGCFLMTQAFSRLLTQDSKAGSIINIGSGCNKLAFPNLVDYSASKGGIEMLTKSSAHELGPHGIRVNCIAPGAIATDRTTAETSDYEKSWSALTPLRRIGKPQDVANAVLLLCDEKAAFITGQTINVDGGLFSNAPWPSQY